MIAINIQKNELFVFDSTGMVEKHEVLANGIVTSAILGAYIKQGKFFANVKYMPANVKCVAQQAGIWVSGEDCYVEQTTNPLL
jgi:hypothetical protein